MPARPAFLSPAPGAGASGPFPAGDDLPPEVRRALEDPMRRLGRYVTLDELGRGGMGVVLRAYDPGLRRSVAIKMIGTGEARVDETAIRRFQVEARAAARIRHPNIVAVHEVAEHEGRPFIVMDLIEGRTLEAVIDDERWPARRLAELIAKVARALDHAHGLGIVHRDVKPGNVLVNRESEPHLGDFGLAFDVAGEDRLTKTGQLIGTPSYAAPEQARGDRKAIGPRSDVYSIGAVLYHAFTGRPPFIGGTLLEVLRQVHEVDPLPLRELKATIHADLETITLKCMEKEPARRYEQAIDVARDLERFLDGEAIAARPLGRRQRIARWARRHRALAGASVIATAAVVGGIVAGAAGVVLSYRQIQEQRDRAEAESGRAREAEARAQSAADASAIERARVVAGSRAKDELLGRALAEKAARHVDDERWDEAGALAARSLDLVENGTARTALAAVLDRLQPTEWVSSRRAAISIAWSADGNLIATGHPLGMIDVWNAETGRAIAALHGHERKARALAFSPDGRFLASGADDATVRLWDVEARAPVAVLRGLEGDVESVAWAHDGARVAAASRGGRVLAWSVAPTIAGDGGEGAAAVEIATHAGGASAVAWDPAGGRVATGGADGAVHLLELATGAIETIVRRGAEHPVTALAWSASGSLAIGLGDPASIVTDRESAADGRRGGHHGGTSGAGGEASPEPGEGEDAFGAALAAEERYPRVELVLLDPATAREIGSFEEHRGAVTSLAFSSDGKRLASGDIDGAVYARSLADARGEARAVDRFDAQPVRGVAWHVDGRRLAAAAGDGSLRITDVPSGELRAELVGHGGGDWSRRAVWGASNGAAAVAWSPDGSRLVTVGADETLRIWDAADGDQLLVLDGHDAWIDEVDWSPDGRWIASVADDTTCRIWDAETGEQIHVLPHEAAKDHNRAVYEVEFSPDGSRLATGGRRRVFDVWDAATGARIVELGPVGIVDAFAWSPDGRTIATCGHDQKLRLWPIPSEPPRPEGRKGGEPGKIEPLATIEPQGSSWDLAWSPDGKWIAVGLNTGRVAIIDALEHKSVAWLEGHASGVGAVAWHPDSALLATGGGRDVRIWNVAARTTVLLLEHGATVNDLAWSPDGTRLAVVDRTAALTVRRMLPLDEGRRAFPTGCGVGRLDRGPTGRIAAACLDGTVRFLRLDDEPEVIASRVSGPGWMRCVTWMPDGERYAASHDGTLFLRRVANGDEIAKVVVDAKKQIEQVWAGPDGKAIAVAAGSRRVELFDAETLKRLKPLEGIPFAPSALAWSPDATSLASAASYEGTHVFDVASGEKVAVLDDAGHSWAADWSSDGTRLAVGSNQHDVRIYETATWRALATLRGHENDVRQLAWSPDGRFVASGSDDTSIRVWSAERYEIALVLEGHQQAINGLAWSADGRWLVSGSDSTEGIFVWDAGLLLRSRPDELVERLAIETRHRVQGLDAVLVTNRLRLVTGGR